MRAGFAQIDITPPLGTLKVGWIRQLVSEVVLDPLFARAAVFESGDRAVAFVQLDTLSVRWTAAMRMRQRIEDAHGFPAGHIMVAATHNHAGPAMANVGDVPRDDAYVDDLVDKVVAVFGQALDSAAEAEVGWGRGFEFDLTSNRRVVMRDGTTKTHGSFSDPDALCFEGPIDPEVGVLAARRPSGEWLGALVNFACHPTHHGGGGDLSAGFPGVLVNAMRDRGCPATLFLNGATGNIHDADPTGRRPHLDKEALGGKLAEDAAAILDGMAFRQDVDLACRSTTVDLPYREITDDEVRGTVRGAQRFVDPALYDKGMPRLTEKIRARGSQPAEVQAILVGEVAFVSIPAEYFVEHGLRIKEETWPTNTWVVSCANGMVGYVPTQAAFLRGGYETTFGFGSHVAPSAGDILADAAISVVKGEAGVGQVS